MFLVMDYIKGSDIQRHMERRNINKLDEARLQSLAIPIAEGLVYLHNKGIIHRDVKQENILLSNETDESEPVICDFGFSVRLKDKKTCNQMCGTKGYMAPEILARQPYSFPVDVWSFGVMLYGLISERLPFHVPNDALNDNNVHIAYELIENAELDFTGPEWDNVSDALKGLLMGMLEKEPRTRLTAEAVLNHPWMTSDFLLSNSSVIMPIRRKTNDSNKLH